MRSYKPRKTIIAREPEKPAIPQVIPGEKLDVKKALQSLRARGVNVQLPEASVSKDVQQSHFRLINGRMVWVNPEKTLVRPVHRPLPVVRPRPPMVKLPPLARFYDWKQVMKKDISLPTLYDLVDKDIAQGKIKLLPNEDVVMRILQMEILPDGIGFLSYIDNKGIGRNYLFQLSGTRSSHKFEDFLRSRTTDRKKFIIGINPLDAQARNFMDSLIMKEKPIEKSALTGEPGSVGLMTANFLEGVLRYIRPYDNVSPKIIVSDEDHKIAIAKMPNGTLQIYTMKDAMMGNFQYPRIFQDMKHFLETVGKAAYKPLDIHGIPWDVQKTLEAFDKVMASPSIPETFFKEWRESVSAELMSTAQPVEYGMIEPGVAYEILHFYHEPAKEWAYGVTLLRKKMNYYKVLKPFSQVFDDFGKAGGYIDLLKKVGL